MSATDRRADALVLTFAGLMAVAMIAMLIDLPQVILLAIPLLVASLLYLSVCDAPENAGRRAALRVLHLFNALSLIIWIVVVLALNGDRELGGLPLSTAVLGYIAWPFYSVAGGLMYALVSRLTGVYQQQSRLSGRDG